MIGLVYCSLKLSLGTLYPAYESFKAVKNRHVKEYVKWMTYWIVFSLLSLVEEVTDIFLAWLPLYTPAKIGILLWLISPTTRGASVVYRGLVHPALVTREDDIDQFVQEMLNQSYTTAIRYTQLAAQKFTKTMIETAIKGGGGLVTTLKRSVSMNDLDQSEDELMQQDRSYSRRRQQMTKSWHEAYQDEEPLYSRGGISPSKTLPRSRSKREGSSFKSSRHLTTPNLDTRIVPYGRRRPKEMSARDDDFGSEASSDSAYSTLPRAAKRRSQPLEAAGGASFSTSRPPKTLQSSAPKSVSSSNLSTIPSTRRRAQRGRARISKGIITEKDSEFSMSYSDSNTVKEEVEGADSKKSFFGLW